MAANYQDCMALVKKFGKPDLFVTMTTNPKWDEIQKALYPGQTAQDRPDIVARVFKIKLEELIHEVKKGCFGQCKAFSYTIEFQKRGLPHAHILIILENKHEILRNTDNFVCAEIPDPATCPILYDYVTKHMIHGPCGQLNLRSPCMNDGCCSKKFPKLYK